MENLGCKVYLLGSITVDFPEAVINSQSARQLQTLTINGESASLTYHPLELAISPMNDQLATGTPTAFILKWKLLL